MKIQKKKNWSFVLLLQKDELERLRKKSPEQLWMDDLDQFLVQLDVSHRTSYHMYFGTIETERERGNSPFSSFWDTTVQNPDFTHQTTDITHFAVVFIPPATKLGGVYWNHPVRLSVRPSVRL